MNVKQLRALMVDAIEACRDIAKGEEGRCVYERRNNNERSAQYYDGLATGYRLAALMIERRLP